MPISVTGEETQAKARSLPPAAAIARATTVQAYCEEGKWSYTRNDRCLSKYLITYRLLSDKGQIIGLGEIGIDQTITLNSYGPSWNENVSATLLSISGAITSLDISFDASCAAPCTTPRTRPWAGTWSLFSVGQTASGYVTYEDTPVVGTHHDTQLTYHVVVTTPGATPIEKHALYKDAGIIRCDNEVGGGPGCVYSQIRPVVDLSLSTYGAAAATYWYAENKLIDGWGKDQPLHRLADAATAEKKRKTTCEDGTFVTDPNVVLDSCDEYPFAATYEGGTPGALCADLVPKLENGIWNYYYYTGKPIKGTEKCIRGHVPLGENTGAGGELGRFTVAKRILDNEGYYVNITTP